MKKLSFLLIVFAIALSANAQLLWKISGKGLPASSYVFGTHHIAPLTILDDIKGFDSAFKSCTQMYGEVDMADMAAIQAKAAQYVMAPQDSTLDKVFNADDYKIIAEGIKRYMNVDAAQVAMLKPAALTTSIAVMQAAKTFASYNPAQQLDATLQQRAKENNASVKGLETADFQLELLFNNPVKDQAADLLKLLKDEAKMVDFTKRLTEDYMKQDLAAMFSLMNDPVLGSSEAEMQRLMYSRNANWAKQLPAIMKQAPTFVAVGAGHLVGDKGLLTMLRNAGYKIEPVK